MKFTRILRISLIILALTPIFCRADQPKKWEYKVVAYRSALQATASQALSGELNQKKLEDVVTLKLEEMLNKLGSEGWELVSDSEDSFILKRPKSE